MAPLITRNLPSFRHSVRSYRRSPKGYTPRGRNATIGGMADSMVYRKSQPATPLKLDDFEPAARAVLPQANGLWPISWIVLNAVFFHNLTIASGDFDVIRRSLTRLTGDRRVQALLVAFCFGALMEGIAGFGAPVAISAAILASLGFEPISAAVLALLANTAPVAFGSIGIP